MVGRLIVRMGNRLHGTHPYVHRVMIGLNVHPWLTELLV
jgi:hypothetical protein